MVEIEHTPVERGMDVIGDEHRPLAGDAPAG